MADKLSLMQEAARRGILPPEKKALYDEAVRRGLIQGQQIEMLPSHSKTTKRDWRNTVSEYGKTGLEVAGMTVGGIVGGAAGLLGGPAAPASVPVGAAVGGGLGYAMGRQGGYILDDILLGIPQQSIPQAAVTAATDIGTGAALEMGGQVIGLAAPAIKSAAAPIIAGGVAYPAAKWSTGEAPETFGQGVTDVATGAAMGAGVAAAAKLPSGFRSVRERIPGTQAAIEAQASAILRGANASPELNALSSAEANNTARTEKLLRDLNITDVRPTPAQTSGSYRAGHLEQALSTQGTIGARLDANDAKLAAAARNKLFDALPNSAPVSAKSAGSSGEETVAALRANKDALKSAEAEAWNAVKTQYGIETKGTSKAFNDINSDIVPPDIKATASRLEDFFNSAPKTVKGLRAVEQEVTSKIKAASMAGKDNEARILSKIKDGIISDMEALAAAAKSGNLYEYEGKLVYPEALQKELVELEAKQTAAKTIDTKSVIEELARRKIPAMRMSGETAQSFNARITKDYQRATGQEPPLAVSPQEQAAAKRAAEEAARIRQTLTEMQPADDVAAQIRTAKDLTIEKYDRFKSGVTEDILARGKKTSGQRVEYENVPERYFNESGAVQLVKGVGQQEAKRLTTEHVKRQFAGMSKNGVLDITQAVKFTEKNAATLKRLGLTEETNAIIAEQIPAAIRARLEKRMVTDRFGNQTNTITDVRGAINDLLPAMRKIKGGQEQITGLLNYHRMLETLARNKNVNYAKGSNSWDKAMGVFEQAPPKSFGGVLYRSLADAIAGASAGAAVGGIPGMAVGGLGGIAARGAKTGLQEHQKRMVIGILERATFDPEYAAMMNKMANGYKPKTIEMKLLIDKIDPTWTAAGSAAAVVTTRDERQ